MIFELKVNILLAAAEYHILSVVETMRQQQLQMAAMLQQIMTLVQHGSHTSTPEMPADVQLPLSSLQEVESMEEWLGEDGNKALRKNVVGRQ